MKNRIKLKEKETEAHPSEKFLDCPCLSLRQASRMVAQLFDEALIPVELLSTQLPVLVLVSLHQPLTITRLASLLVMDRTTLTRVMKPLFSRGLIKTTTSRDKRKSLLQITPKGIEVLEEAYPLWKKTQRQIVGGLGDDQWKIVREKLGRVVQIASYM